MNKSQVIKELNSLIDFHHAAIEKAERLRLALGVSTPGGLKKKAKKDSELSQEQQAKILGRRKKYFAKKAAALEQRTAIS